MKLSEYEAIRAHLTSLPCRVFPDMDALKATHAGVSLDTLVSIYSQESSRRIRVSHGRHVRGIEAYARRYLAGEDIFAVADAIDFPPCQLMRLLLEHLLGLGHKTVGLCLRDPFAKIPETPPEGTPAHVHPNGGAQLCRRLRVDVERCVAWDHVASPAVDTLRHTAGREYEEVLEEKLTTLGIPFVTEGTLRAEGHAKTPDIKLELPIAVKGRIVNWIDSKASFCDPLVHGEERGGGGWGAAGEKGFALRRRRQGGKKKKTTGGSLYYKERQRCPGGSTVRTGRKRCIEYVRIFHPPKRNGRKDKGIRPTHLTTYLAAYSTDVSDISSDNFSSEQLLIRTTSPAN